MPGATVALASYDQPEPLPDRRIVEQIRADESIRGPEIAKGPGQVSGESGASIEQKKRSDPRSPYGSVAAALDRYRRLRADRPDLRDIEVRLQTE